MSLPVQPAILRALWPAGQVLGFRLTAPQQGKPLLRALLAHELGDHTVVGLGPMLVSAFGGVVPGLRQFPELEFAPGAALPSSPMDVWAMVGGDSPAEVHDRVRALTSRLPGGLVWAEDLATFTWHGGRDLTGYEDGTENPAGDAAWAAAFLQEGAFAGSSFVAAMRWQHDLAAFAALPEAARDHIMGRRIRDNAEIADAPPSAHVKRAAQESFDPPAFMLRRSMPWAGAERAGLYFVAYGADLDRFERVLRRMLGLEDGIADALLGYSSPQTGAYFWCPPVREGRLDLGAVLPAGGVDALPDVENAAP
jgi:putative iron-dependent peroxidase